MIVKDGKTLDVQKVVKELFTAFPNWKPVSDQNWHLNTQSQFEKKYKKNVKQIFGPGYKAVEVFGDNYYMIMTQDVISLPLKSGPLYEVKITDSTQKKLIYSKKHQDTSESEEGSLEQGVEILKQASDMISESPKVNLLYMKKTIQRG